MKKNALQSLLSSIGASTEEIPPLYHEERIGELGQSEVILTSILSLDFESITQEPEPYSAKVEIGLFFRRTVQEEGIAEDIKTRIERIELKPFPRTEVRGEVLDFVRKEVKRRVDQIVDRLVQLIIPKGEAQ